MKKILAVLMTMVLCCIVFVGCDVLGKIGIGTTDEHEHNFQLIEQKEATCTEGGGKTFKCECGIIQMSDVTEALGHDEIKYEAKDPTCTSKGWEAYTGCSRCDYYSSRTDIAALGHNIKDHEGKAATCTEKGYEPYETCTRCDYTTYGELPLTDHVYDDVQVTEPTPTSKGYTTYTCDCGVYYVDNFTAPSNHSLNLKYQLLSDGSGYIVTGIGQCKDTDIIIPEKYNALPVVGIGNSAFEYCYFVETVKIPDSVTYIGEYAFGSCKKLKSVYFGENSNLTDIMNCAFYYSSMLDEITIPSSVTSIGHHAFYYSSAITEITIPSSVTLIGVKAFYACQGLQSVTFENNSNLQVIDEAAFCMCDSLLSISVPDSVTVLGNGAFQHCKALTSVRLGNGITQIGDSTFANCTNLTEIVIPETVFYINERAFNYSCDNLTVYYKGNRTGWDNIDFESYYYNEILGSPLYFYLETRPAVDGNYWYYSKTGELRFWSLSYDDEWDDNTGSGDGDGWSEDDFPDVTTLTYELSTDGTYYIVTGFEIIYGESLIIPAEIDGIPVKAIGDDAFWGLNVITTVTIPDSIEVIGKYAFASCSDITTFNFGNGLIRIEDEAFYSCVSLASIDLPDSLTHIGAKAFMGCSSLNSVVIPAGVTQISDSAFYSCRYLQNVVLPDTLVSIGKSAFSTCSITSISIPDSVISIGDDAFSCNTGLGYINLGAGVKTIGKDAFAMCINLYGVYYVGTKEEFESIRIDSGNDSLTDAYIYYESSK